MVSFHGKTKSKAKNEDILIQKGVRITSKAAAQNFKIISPSILSEGSKM